MQRKSTGISLVKMNQLMRPGATCAVLLRREPEPSTGSLVHRNPKIQKSKNPTPQWEFRPLLGRGFWADDIRTRQRQWEAFARAIYRQFGSKISKNPTPQWEFLPDDWPDDAWIPDGLHPGHANDNGKPSPEPSTGSLVQKYPKIQKSNATKGISAR